MIDNSVVNCAVPARANPGTAAMLTFVRLSGWTSPCVSSRPHMQSSALIRDVAAVAVSPGRKRPTIRTQLTPRPNGSKPGGNPWSMSPTVCSGT